MQRRRPAQASPLRCRLSFRSRCLSRCRRTRDNRRPSRLRSMGRASTSAAGWMRPPCARFYRRFGARCDRARHGASHLGRDAAGRFSPRHGFSGGVERPRSRTPPFNPQTSSLQTSATRRSRIVACQLQQTRRSPPQCPPMSLSQCIMRARRRRRGSNSIVRASGRNALRFVRKLGVGARGMTDRPGCRVWSIL